MTTLALNRFAHRLKKAGMPAAQVDVLVQELHNMDMGNLVTNQHLTNELLKLKVDLLKWLIPILLGQVAVFAFLVKWLLA